MKRVVSQGNQKSIETTISHIRLGTVALETESNPRKGNKEEVTAPTPSLPKAIPHGGA
jgi:hypothetical protein